MRRIQLRKQEETIVAGTQVDVRADVRIKTDALRAWGIEAFTRAGLPPDGAAEVTEVQLEANLRGQPTHNMGGVPGYAKRMKGGMINTACNIRVTRETMVSAQIDGDNGPGQWVSVVAMRHAIRKAKASGVGVVVANHSNHYGAAGHYAWMAATEGLIGLTTTNGGLVLAPWGGTAPTFGNNPFGVGIPTGRALPIVLDIAMSVVAQGKIGLAIAEGKPILPGWMFDKNGRISTNPADFHDGFGVPIAEHKGAGLALVMETLAGILSGAGFGRDHSRETMRDDSRSPNLGHFFLAINPEMFMTTAEFTSRVDRMADEVKAVTLAPGIREVLAPGEIEMRHRAANVTAGSVPILPSTLRGLETYSKEAGIKAALTVA
jgi:LDH2 family malate/lactate/ureidoglycolate dehydrogenase